MIGRTLSDYKILGSLGVCLNGLWPSGSGR